MNGTVPGFGRIEGMDYRGQKWQLHIVNGAASRGANAMNKVEAETDTQYTVHPQGRTRFWLIAATAVFLAATVLAFIQNPRPDPYSPVPSLFSLDGWRYPLERNPHLRLSTIGATLNDVFARDDRHIWAVGDGGRIVYSDDGGQSWTRQGLGISATLAANSPAARLGDSLIRSVEAGQPGPPAGLTSDIGTGSYGDNPAQNPVPTFGQTPPVVEPGQQDKIPQPQVGTPKVPATPSIPPVPVIADLQAVYFLADAQRGWAVGSGGAILATVDGGKTWRAQSSGTTFGLYDIVFDADGRRGWIAGEGTTILATTDGGNNWQNQTKHVRKMRVLEAIAFAADGKRGWAVGSDGAILATVDGGNNWSAKVFKTHPDFHGMYFAADGQRGWAVGSNGTILATTDGGNDWLTQNIGTGEELFDIDFAADGKHGWAVGVDSNGFGGAVLSTIDGGKTWQHQIASTDDLLLGLNINDEGRHGWLVGLNGVILKTLDGGSSWHSLNRYSSEYLQALCMIEDGKRVWVVGKAGTVLVTNDGGYTWLAQDSGTKEALYDIYFSADGQRGWAVGSGGTILATTDGGDTWRAQDSKTNEILKRIVFAADGQRGWAVGIGGTILATTDGGDTWSSHENVSGNFKDIAINVNGHGVVVIGGLIVVTGDGDMIWQAKKSEYLLEGLAFSADAKTGFAVGFDGVILVTVDGGSNWRRLNSDTPNDLLGIAIAADGKRGWAVGSRGTILATTNGGDIWRAQPSGTGFWLRDIAFSTDGQHGWVVGSGGTILATVDGGNHWWSAPAPYRRWPAPWYYLSWLVSGLLLWPVLGRRVSTPPVRKSIADMAASDRPIDSLAEDRLDFRPIVKGLTRFLRNRHTEPKLVIAVTGRWGTGKSSLMGLLRNTLHDEGFCPVWFNAWHHQKEEQFLASLLHGLRREAVPGWFSLGGFWFRLQLLWQRPAFYKFLMVALLASLALAFGYLSEGQRARELSQYLAYASGFHRPMALTDQSFRALRAGEASRQPLDATVLTRLEQRLRFTPTGSGQDCKAADACYTSEHALTRAITTAIQPDRLSDAQVRAVLAAAENFPPPNPFAPVRQPALVLLTLTTAALALLIKGMGLVGFNWRPLLDRLLGRPAPLRDNEPLGFRAAIRPELKRVTDVLGRRLVIFIDDLDRCRRDQVLQILEGINFLVSEGNCFVVLGMAPDYVQACIGLEYKEMAEEIQELRQGAPGIPSGPQASTLVVPGSPAHDGQQLRQRFALNYLEKLINIELPVPVPDVVQTQRLMQGDDATSQGEFSRSTNATVVFGIKLLAVLAFLAWLWIQCWQWGDALGDGWHSGEPPPVERPGPLVQPGSVPAPPNLDAVEPLKVDRPAGEAVFRPGEHDASRHLNLLIGPLLLLAGGLLWFLRRNPSLVAGRPWLRDTLRWLKIHVAGPEPIEDSSDFTDALAIWSPVVAQQSKTPRNLKRFKNRVRFFAMRHSAGSAPETDGGTDTGNRWQAHLVALGAIHNLDPGWLEREELFMAYPVGPPFPNSTVSARSPDEVDKLELIGKTIAKHAETFGEWPPSAEERQFFKSISRDIKIR